MTSKENIIRKDLLVARVKERIEKYLDSQWSSSNSIVLIRDNDIVYIVTQI